MSCKDITQLSQLQPKNSGDPKSAVTIILQDIF